MLSIEIDRTSLRCDATATEDYMAHPIAFRLQTQLLLYVERFGQRSSKSASSEDVVPAPEARAVSEGDGGVPAPTVACENGSRNPSPLGSATTTTTTSASARAVHCSFTRTPLEFAHLLETLQMVFPSLLLPRWPMIDEKPLDHLSTVDFVAALVHATLRYLAVLDEVVSSDVFIGFVDHQTCPRGKFGTLKVQRRPLDDEHALGRVHLTDRALQPLTANMKSLDPTTAEKSQSHVLRTETAFLRHLSVSLHAFIAESVALRGKLLKDVTERIHRRRGALMMPLTAFRERSLQDHAVTIAKAGGGKTLDEHAACHTIHLGDRICSSVHGPSLAGTVSYVGPITQKRSERLVGVTWDEALPFAKIAANRSNSPTSPSQLDGGGGMTDTQGKFACRPHRGSVQRASQLYRDPCDDTTIAAILQACVHVDRGLAPPDAGEYGTVAVSDCASMALGTLAAQVNFFSGVNHWISKILTSYRTMLLAEQWLCTAAAAPQPPIASPQSSTTTTTASPSSSTPTTNSNSKQPQFDAVVIKQHVASLETSLVQCVVDFRSAWACFGSARHTNHRLLAEQFVSLISLYDRVEADICAGGWTPASILPSSASTRGGSSSRYAAAQASGNGGSSPFGGSASQYGAGTLDGVFMEVDSVFEHFEL